MEEEKAKLGLPSIGIPSEVLFNPFLSQTEKILFGLLRNLSQSKRGCWASNSYLANLLLGVSNQTVSNSISKLEQFRYIYTVREQVKNKMLGRFKERRIYINPEYQLLYRPVIEMVHDKLFDDLNEESYEVLLGNLKDHIKNFILPYKASLNKDDIEDESIRREILSKESTGPSALNSHSPNSHNGKKEKTYSKISDYPGQVKDLLDHWNSLDIIKHTRESSTMDSILEQLHKKSQKYSTETIKRSMTKYKSLLEDPFTILKNKSPYKVGLNNFFKFDDTYCSTKGYKDLEGVVSWFDECLKEDHSHLMKVRKDQYPNVTNKLKSEYNKKIGVYTVNDENAFRKASVLVMDFLKKNKTKLRVDTIMKRNPVQFVPLLFDYLGEHEGNGIHPGWLTASFEHGMFKEWLTKNNYVVDGYRLT